MSYTKRRLYNNPGSDASTWLDNSTWKKKKFSPLALSIPCQPTQKTSIFGEISSVGGELDDFLVDDDTFFGAEEESDDNQEHHDSLSSYPDINEEDDHHDAQFSLYDEEEEPHPLDSFVPSLPDDDDDVTADGDSSSDEEEENDDCTVTVHDHDDHGAANPFNDQDQAMFELITFCNSAGTPINFLDKFLRLIKKHVKDGSLNPRKFPSRESVMSKLRAKLPHAPLAHLNTSDSSSTVAPNFDFLQQLDDLLSSQYFQTDEPHKYLCINHPDEGSSDFDGNPFSKYRPHRKEGLNEVPCADWYKKTYDQRIGDHPIFVDKTSGLCYHNWLFPIVFYNDKTGVSQAEGLYSLEPLVFTSGLLRLNYRENADAWRYKGLIPCANATPDKSSSNAPEQDSEQQEEEDHAGLGDGEKKRLSQKKRIKPIVHFHDVLGLLLKDVEEAQKNPPLREITLGKKTYRVRLIIEVCFVMGDQLSQDTHCARMSSSQAGASRVHRQCMQSFFSAGEFTRQESEDQHRDNFVHPECCNVDKRVLGRLVSIVTGDESPTTTNEQENHDNSMKMFFKTRSKLAKEILTQIYRVHPIRNGWSRISFGSNPNGINEATLDDPLHFFSSGWCSYLNGVSFGILTPSECSRVEEYLAENMLSRSSKRNTFPRGKFSSGFTNCTLQTASQKVGLVFALFLSLQTDPRVLSIYDKAILRRQVKYVDADGCKDIHSHLGEDYPDSAGYLTIKEKGFFSDHRNERTASNRRKKAEEKKQEDDALLKSNNPAAWQAKQKKKNSTNSGDNDKPKSLIMPRNKETMKVLIRDLHDFGLVSVVGDDAISFDPMQVEYLVQILWQMQKTIRRTLLPLRDNSRLARGARKALALARKDNSTISVKFLYGLLDHVHSHLVQPTEEDSIEQEHGNGYNFGIPFLCGDPPCIPKVLPPRKKPLKRIEKHQLVKPKVAGRGNTAAVLTDSKGFRKALEYTLVFYSLVHL